MQIRIIRCNDKYKRKYNKVVNISITRLRNEKFFAKIIIFIIQFNLHNVDVNRKKKS